MKPLTNEQRDALAQEMDAVERTARIAARRFNGRVTFDDALSSASYGAMRATSTHDASKGRTLRSHIYTRANGQIIDDIRSTIGRNRKTGNPSAYMPVSLNATLADGNNRECVESSLSVADPGPVAVDDNEAADAMIQKIAPQCERTRKAIRMVWIDGYTMREAGAAVGLGESRISQLLRQARLMGRDVLRNLNHGINTEALHQV